jgi:hypothetical protein
MKKHPVRKAMFGMRVLLCLSYLVLVNGGQIVLGEAKERNLPIGEMVSRGEVRFEARENTWRDVEPFHFPVFKGSKIRTDQGVSAITLTDQTRIEVGKQSLISFSPGGELTLIQGEIGFQVPSSCQGRFRVGSLSIAPAQSDRTAKSGGVISGGNKEIIGSLSIHSNGALTVKSLRGNLSIFDQDDVVLALLSQMEQVTMPSTVVSGKERFVVSQVGDIEDCEEPKIAWFSWEGPGIGGWGAILLNAGFLGAVVTQSSESSDDHPICK